MKEEGGNLTPLPRFPLSQTELNEAQISSGAVSQAFKLHLYVSDLSERVSSNVSDLSERVSQCSDVHRRGFQ